MLPLVVLPKTDKWHLCTWNGKIFFILDKSHSNGKNALYKLRNLKSIILLTKFVNEGREWEICSLIIFHKQCREFVYLPSMFKKPMLKHTLVKHNTQCLVVNRKFVSKKNLTSETHIVEILLNIQNVHNVSKRQKM